VKRAFSVTALVSSLNKPAKSEHVLVLAEDEADAKKKAKIQIQRKHPDGSVQIGNVRE
jgi:hypothetical protein